MSPLRLSLDLEWLQFPKSKISNCQRLGSWFILNVRDNFDGWLLFLLHPLSNVIADHKRADKTIARVRVLFSVGRVSTTVYEKARHLTSYFVLHKSYCDVWLVFAPAPTFWEVGSAPRSRFIPSPLLSIWCTFQAAEPEYPLIFQPPKTRRHKGETS